MGQRDEVQNVEVTSAPSQASQEGTGEVYCSVCGRDGNPALKRFGQLFCSEAHVAQYASERQPQADLVETSLTAVDAKNKGNEGTQAMSCGIGTKGGLRKMGWCLAGGAGLLVAIPLIASGGLAAAAGSVLSVAAVLACPIGMYFMMRGMMKMGHKEQPKDESEGK